MSNAEHHVFLAHDSEFIAPPVDIHEADRIEWIRRAQAADLERTGASCDFTAMR